jgi:F0F1-type ATP synthase assembly protein I
MTKTETPLKTPSPTNSFGLRKVGRNASPNSIFVSMALDMSWRLAVAVLVPIIGGFELDRKLNTSPLLLIVGFIIAMAGMGLVLWQTLQAANNLTIPNKERRP